MSRSVIGNHPYRAEIEQAIREGQSVRQIGRRFNVEHTVVFRYKQKLLAGTPSDPSPDESADPSPPVLALCGHDGDRTKQRERNGNSNSNTPQNRLNPDQPDQPELDDFDLLALPRFPWAGETPRPAPIAQQLREQQRRFGIEPVKRQIIALVADNAAVMSDVALAQRLDVEPRTIARWRGILAAEGKAGLASDPAKTVAEDLSTLETVKRACLRRLADERTSDSAQTAAIDRLLRTMREARDLKEAHGLIRPVHVEDQLPEPNHPDYYAIMGGRVLSTTANVILALTARTLGIGEEVEDAIANDRPFGKLLEHALEDRFEQRVAEEVARRRGHPTDPTDQDDEDEVPEGSREPEPVVVVEPTTIDEPDPPAPEPEHVIEPVVRPRTPPQRTRIAPFADLILDG